MDVINECLVTCNKSNVDHYLKKNQNKQIDLQDIENINGSELENEEDSVSLIITRFIYYVRKLKIMNIIITYFIF